MARGRASWRASANHVQQLIVNQAWDEKAQAISAHLDGGGVLDASLLALPLRAVIPADHPRMLATANAISERLSAGDGLLYRYLHDEAPDGLAGDRIPFEARIVAVVDAFDAMTTSRAYREAREPADAMEELRRHAGTQFDPAVVEAFLAAFPDPSSLPVATPA